MRVAILTPMRNGQAHHAFSESLAMTMRSIRNVDLAWFKAIGCTILPDARSMCLAQALEWGADKVVFIDDDISWTPADFRWLITHKVGACTGAYSVRKRSDNEQTTIAVKFLNGNGKLPEGTDERGLVEVESAGFGFIRFDREVFEALRPHTQRMHETSLPRSVNEHYRDWFPYGFRQNGNLSLTAHDLATPAARGGEDIFFCCRVRELGYPLFLDPTITLGHHDGAREYRVEGLLKHNKEI